MIKHRFRLIREVNPGKIVYSWRCVVCDYWIRLSKTRFRAVMTVPELAGEVPWSKPSPDSNYKLEYLIPQCRLADDSGNRRQS